MDIGSWGSRQGPVLLHNGHGHLTKGGRSEPVV